MSKPKIVLKNIKVTETRRGITASADVHVNGMFCLYAYDDGNGGGLWTRKEYSEDLKKNAIIKENIELLEKYVQTLPIENHSIDDEVFQHKPTVEDYIDKLINETVLEKHLKLIEKRFKKHSNSGIIIGTPDNHEQYKLIDFKKPLSEVKLSSLQFVVDTSIKKHSADGLQILNKKELLDLGVRL